MKRPAKQVSWRINGFQRCSDLLRRGRVEGEEMRHAVGVGGEGATIELALSLSKGLSTSASSLACAFDNSGGIVSGSYKSASVLSGYFALASNTPCAATAARFASSASGQMTPLPVTVSKV